MSRKNHRLPPLEDVGDEINVRTQVGHNTSQISHINDEDNLVKPSKGNSTSRTNNHLDSSTITPLKLAVLPLTTDNTPVAIGIQSDEYREESFRRKTAILLNSKPVDYFLMGLIVFYVMLVLVNIVIDDGSCTSGYGLIKAVLYLKYIELGILGIFIIEILIKAVAMGMQAYFKDWWRITDVVILLATLALLILDLTLDENTTGLRQERGIFRLFRIFMLYRKVTTFRIITKNRIRQVSHTFQFKSHVERALDLLHTLKDSTRDKKTTAEIEWAIDIISQNKLYEVAYGKGLNDEKSQEVNQWMNNFGANTPAKEPARRQSFAGSANSRARLGSMTAAPPLAITNILDETGLELEFNIFNFSKMAKGQELSMLLNYFFEKNGLFDELGISQDIFMRFAKKIQSGYRKNPYHNSTHGADVLQTCAYFTMKCDFKSIGNLDHFDIAALFISAAAHDYDHPGYNNAYHINSQHELAIRYNDKAVLENHHVASTFSILKDKEYNIFEGFNTPDFKNIREKMITLILATDMGQHFSELALLKTRISADFDPKGKDKLLCLRMLLHSADIGNPGKPFIISEEWSLRCLNEYWIQGDTERENGLPISFLCDRYTTNTSKSQISFIDIFSSPTWGLVQQFLPNLDCSNFEKNKNVWKEREAMYDEQLKKLNEEKEAKEQKDGILADG